MRISYWLVIITLIAAATFVFWPSRHSVTSSVPGQYPLDKKRPHWHATQSVGLYRPRGSVGQDVLRPSDHIDAKMSCSTSNLCTRPTVPLGPQYEPTILLAED